MPWTMPYKAQVNGRWIVVKHRTPEPEEKPIVSIPGGFTGDWFTGYVEVLPDDPIVPGNYDAYDDAIEAPGGLTFGGLTEFPEHEFLGFDTAHPFMDDMTLDKVIKATRKMLDDIEKFRKKHGQDDV